MTTNKEENQKISSARRKYQKVFTKPSLTKQSFRDECDVNQVMKRFEKTGVIDHQNPRKPVYADVSTFTDYQTSVGIVLRAHEAFEGLPSDIRAQFDNDPGKFLEFFEDPANENKAIELGLIPHPPESTEKSKPGEEDPEKEVINPVDD